MGTAWEVSELWTQTVARSTDVDARQRGVGWRMNIDDAHLKLKAAYRRIML